MAVGVLIRISLLRSGSLWLDELWTLDAISRSFKEMIGARLVSDVHPPLWSMLSWIWLRIVGTYEPGAMRLLPLGFSLAAIAVPVLGAVRLPSLRPALLVMSALLGLSLFTIQYAVELRSYSMMIALGTAATVIWAGLLVGDLPRRGSWIFLFTLTGALTGFVHYYGHLLYLGELGVLLVVWVFSRFRRPVVVLLSWAGLSLVPVTAWFVLTSRWFSGSPVAPPPSISEIQTWLAHTFGPVSNVVADHAPGYAYPDGPFGIETILFGLTIAAIGGAAIFQLARRSGQQISPGVLVGGSALIVILMALVVAWVASLVLPPSMNARNLGALVPPLLLAVACAATIQRTEWMRWLTGSALVGAVLALAFAFTARYGVQALTPPWQQHAGYRPAVEALLASESASPRPTRIGLDTSWHWHGQWVAATRAALGSPPAESSDVGPIAVEWVADVDAAKANGVPDGPVVIVSDSGGQRQADLVAWLEELRGPCQTMEFGGPGFGLVTLFTCP